MQEWQRIFMTWFVIIEILIFLVVGYLAWQIDLLPIKPHQLPAQQRQPKQTPQDNAVVVSTTAAPNTTPAAEGPTEPPPPAQITKHAENVQPPPASTPTPPPASTPALPPAQSIDLPASTPDPVATPTVTTAAEQPKTIAAPKEQPENNLEVPEKKSNELATAILPTSLAEHSPEPVNVESSQQFPATKDISRLKISVIKNLAGDLWQSANQSFNFLWSVYPLTATGKIQRQFVLLSKQNPIIIEVPTQAYYLQLSLLDKIYTFHIKLEAGADYDETVLVREVIHNTSLFNFCD